MIKNNIIIYVFITFWYSTFTYNILNTSIKFIFTTSTEFYLALLRYSQIFQRFNYFYMKHKEI